MQTDYDVIIVGGGVAGMLTAASAATYSHQNLKILLVDRNPPDEVGKKTNSGWTCGDATSKRSIDYVAEHLSIKYGEPEIEHPVEGVLVFSPDHKVKVLFEGEGYVLNRKLLPRRQIQDAKKLGVEFQFQVALEKLIAEDGFIRGVVGRNLVDGSEFKKTAKVIVDATGVTSRLRAGLPIDSHIQREIDRDDLEATGRYIYKFTPGKEDKTYFDPEYCIIHLDQYLAPGGYCWVFPKGADKVNIGLGVQKKALEKRNQRYGLQDNLQSLIDTYVQQNPCVKNPVQASGDEDTGNAKSNWQVPVRRHNDCLVANGYAIVGDAAWMPRPIDAGGIGPAMYSSVILGRVVAEAIQANDFSETGLWKYNLDYMHTYGYQMASFEVLRRYLQTLTNGQIDYGMKHFLSQEDIDHITRREHPEFNKVRLLNPVMWFRIMSHLTLASGLRYAAKKSQALIKHNLSYPDSPSKFSEWQTSLHKELQEAYSRLG